MSLGFEGTKTARRKQRELDRMLNNMRGANVGSINFDDERFDEFDEVAPIYRNDVGWDDDDDYWG